MVSRKVGTVVYREDLSPQLMIIRLMPEAGTRFPPSTAGQYIALSCNDCGLTTKIGVGADGKAIYGPDLDSSGTQKTGTVTHSYSIASAPWEQELHGYLEFYLALEILQGGGYGRLSSAFVKLDPADDRHNTMGYFDRITGAFTLEALTSGYENVFMVGTGTGLAPFVAMAKQLHHDAENGKTDGRRYTLLYTNRTREELGYHQVLHDIARSATFDFVYLPTVSRPTQRDRDDPTMGIGRANNVFRHLYGFATKEQEALAASRDRDGEPGEVAEAEDAVTRTPEPALPRLVSVDGLAERLEPGKTKVLACGNPTGLSDIRRTADRLGIAFDQEVW